MRTARPPWSRRIVARSSKWQYSPSLAQGGTPPTRRGPSRDRLPEPGPDPLAVLGVKGPGPAVSLEFVRSESHQVPQRGSPPDLLGFELPVPQHIIGGLHKLPDPLLAVLQLPGDPFALSDVGQNRQRLGHLPVGVLFRDGREEDVQDLPAVSDHLMLDIGARPVPHQSREHGLPSQSSGLGGEEVGSRPTQHFVTLVAQSGKPEIAHRHDATLQIDGVRHDRRTVVESAVAALALGQRLEGEFLVGDVTRHPHDRVVRHGGDSGGEPDPPVFDGQRVVRVDHFPGLERPGDVPEKLIGLPMREYVVNGPSQQHIGGTVEQPGIGRSHLPILSGGVEYQDDVPHRGEHRPQLTLRRPQRLLAPFALDGHGHLGRDELRMSRSRSVYRTPRHSSGR